jgi:hypothetical protein
MHGGFHMISVTTRSPGTRSSTLSTVLPVVVVSSSDVPVSPLEPASATPVSDLVVLDVTSALPDSELASPEGSVVAEIEDEIPVVNGVLVVPASSDPVALSVPSSSGSES